MNKILSIVLLLCSFYGFAQLFVAEGTIVGLETSQSVLSSQESNNQIDASILGEGTLYLNSTLAQELTSAQEFLDLPSFQLQNASLVHIKTALNIRNQLRIETGVLTLSYDIILHSKAALVLGTNAHINTTTHGQLLYTTQFESSSPLAVVPSVTLLKYTRLECPQGRSQTPLIATSTSSNFGSEANTGYVVYSKIHIPPPELLGAIS